MSNSLDHEMERLIAATPDGRKTFFDTTAFPWVGQLESKWRLMRTELDSLLLSLDRLPGYEEIELGQEKITTDKRWKIFLLCAYGH